MTNVTNLEKIKEICKALVMYPIIKTKLSPMIIMHPFSNSGFISFRNSSGKQVLANIVDDPNHFKIGKIY